MLNDVILNAFIEGGYSSFYDVFNAAISMDSISRNSNWISI
ncbi:hypothetical protein ACFFGV_19635 [Pontibacillus salicampi]|uniref:Uncharacterized protein n=1 Tax=Pontibacillus salicampi TaxID=1449801 RepID=A0ABV6LU56_9BACI